MSKKLFAEFEKKRKNEKRLNKQNAAKKLTLERPIVDYKKWVRLTSCAMCALFLIILTGSFFNMWFHYYQFLRFCGADNCHQLENSYCKQLKRSWYCECKPGLGKILFSFSRRSQKNISSLFKEKNN